MSGASGRVREVLDNALATEAHWAQVPVADTDRPDRIGATQSIGTVGDSSDNSRPTVIGLFKTELQRNPAVPGPHGGHLRGLDDPEIATCGRVAWFNEERFHGEFD